MSSGKSNSLWDSPPFLRELVLTFHDLAADAGGLSQEKKDHVVQVLAANGFEMTWNALRMAPVQKWDEKVHENVLIAILEGMTFNKEQWSSIMTILHGQGYTFTEGALRYVQLAH
ncbi:hypothetical protein NLU13_6328 [Sarocladium strictum]|uniref:Uncharacterized protein n=1 Tax=Sarocladium strictum TaxID=5046 RepID=A0AA39L707_SARSR|nr:hypothetical protein NLU13_6328 [Sarocladium strictum]